MTRIKKLLLMLLSLIMISGVLLLYANYYSLLFSKTISGHILAVERISPIDTMSDGKLRPGFSIAVQTKSGKIFTATATDRQWAVASTSYCVEAKIFPYPPWDTEKAGTFFGARLLNLYQCEKGEIR